MSDEYKIIADKIVSPDPDIVVSIAGAMYKDSIAEANRYTTVSDGVTLQVLDAHETYEDFIAEHPTGEPGDLHIVGGVLYAWNVEDSEWVNSGTLRGEAADFLNVNSNIVPDTDNAYSLGTAEKRFSGIHVGPGTIYITDTVTNVDAELTVTSGVLKIDGANQLQVGDLKFVDNTIESVLDSTDIEIGLTSSSGDLVLNRNTVLASGKSLTFPDDTVQTTAYIVPTETSYVIAGGTAGTQPIFNGAPLFTGSYIRNGSNQVHFQIQVDMNNITNFGTGQYYMTLPFPAKYNYKFRDGCLHDISTGRQYAIGGHVVAGSSTLQLFSTDTQSGTVFDINFTATAPVTLATADNLHIAGNYVAEDE